ncbi:unnamed protein product [Lymnaea stagnalis]|uniref:Major facilitator superfamily (MFS) profile domain-containing protein n=1 Tax=Lymnaea stagnalis TaxID=6523 RepID=A0AAV2HJD1_LYMST
MDGKDHPVVSLDIEEERLMNSAAEGIANVESFNEGNGCVRNDATNNNIISVGEQGNSFLELRLDSGESKPPNRDQINPNHFSDLENGTASLKNVDGVPTSTADHAAGWTHENVSPVCFENSENKSSLLEVHTTDSGRKQHVTPNLDHHGRVTRRCKAVSSCQSLASRVCSWRSMMLLMLHLSFVINTIPKNTTPIAIVCMVRPRSGETLGVGSTNATTIGVTEGVLGSQMEGALSAAVQRNTTGEKGDDFEFDWDSKTVGLVLSAFSFTSWVGPFFGNMVRGYLGNKWTMTLLTLGSALTTLLSPPAARTGPNVLVGLRVISGLAFGGNLPIVSDTVVWWTPESERLTAATVTFSGFNMAGIVTFFIAGFLCSVPIDNGWPFIFYIFGAITLLWTLAWHIMTTQKPEDHPWISDEEKSFIIATRSHGIGAKNTGRGDKPPYRTIMTSVPILVYMVVSSVHMWSVTIVYTYTPVYFSRPLGFTYEETGVLVSAVAFCRLFGAYVWTVIGNVLMKRPGMTTNKNRKIIFTAGSVVSGIFLVAVAFIDSDLRWLAAALMFVVMLSQSVYAVLMPVLALDMAPRYAGFISGVTLSIAYVVAIPGPLMVAALTPTNATTEWATVWLIMAAAMFATLVIFLVFGQASPLPWADADVPCGPAAGTQNDRIMRSDSPDTD